MCTAGAERHPVRLNDKAGAVVPRVEEGRPAEEGGRPPGDLFGRLFHFLFTYFNPMTDTEVALIVISPPLLQAAPGVLERCPWTMPDWNPASSVSI